MNQILHNKISIDTNNKNNKIKFFKAQFNLSIVLFFVTITIFLLNTQIRNVKEYASHKITNNYNILRLYNNPKSSEMIYNQEGQNFTIIGMIEIPKINIYYPIISEANDELLKISPCRISGPMPNEDGNLCIAGHNYDNYKFFSQVSTLENDDEIIIYNINGNKLVYKIYNIYEVSSDNLSPLQYSEGTKKQVTLITCNNFNSSIRIIIKAVSQ